MERIEAYKPHILHLSPCELEGRRAIGKKNRRLSKQSRREKTDKACLHFELHFLTLTGFFTQVDACKNHNKKSILGELVIVRHLLEITLSLNCDSCICEMQFYEFHSG